MLPSRDFLEHAVHLLETCQDSQTETNVQNQMPVPLTIYKLKCNLIQLVHYNPPTLLKVVQDRQQTFYWRGMTSQ